MHKIEDVKQLSVGLLFLMSSCIVRTPGTKQVATQDPTKEYKEDVSALRNTYIQTEIVESKKPEPKPVVAFTAAEPINDNKAIELGLQRLKERNEQLVDAKGYRISVYSGNMKRDFEQAKSYLLQHSPEMEIYESYSQPTYKIKVGDFISRLDAERYFSQLIGRFPTSKIMVDKISLQKSLNLKY